jgi:hypothetical protein
MTTEPFELADDMGADDEPTLPDAPAPKRYASERTLSALRLEEEAARKGDA